MNLPRISAVSGRIQYVEPSAGDIEVSLGLPALGRLDQLVLKEGVFYLEHTPECSGDGVA